MPMLKPVQIVLLFICTCLYQRSYALTRHDPDDCIKINASVFTNGIEGSRDVSIKLKLPTECPAAEDIIINISLQNPQTNNGDFTLPASVTFKRGDTEATLVIPVTDDKYIELTESFTINLTARPTLNGYTVDPGSSLTFTITDNDNTPENRKYTITYTPEIAEGSSGRITIAMPPGILLSEALDFTFVPDNSSHQATTIQDHTPLSISIPAGANSVNFNVNAFIDNVIEGDEFISGSLLTQLTFFGTFTSDDPKIRIKILDYENTPANRIIEITPATDVLNEGSSLTYRFALVQPSATSTIKLEYPLNIDINQQQWASYLKMSPAALVLDNNIAGYTDLTITYPDDQVVRQNGIIKLLVSANDTQTGTYQFRWKSVATDALTINTIDNDAGLVRLELSPTALTIAEGGQGNIALKLADGVIVDSDISINYTWSGTGISTDNRIANKTGTAVLLKGYSTASIPLIVNDDQQIDDHNDYTLTVTAFNYLAQPVTISPQNTVAVTIFDDEYNTLNIPSAFTPNGDSINDRWNIPNLTYDSNCTVNIFDRYGHNLFNSKGYTIPWDGTKNGQAIAAGTYYYIIDTHGKKHSGSITIIR